MVFKDHIGFLRTEFYAQSASLSHYRQICDSAGKRKRIRSTGHVKLSHILAIHQRSSVDLGQVFCRYFIKRVKTVE